MTSHKVKCLDSVYDKENGFLVLHLLLLDINERRIVPILNKYDCPYKGKLPAPDEEMYKLAEQFRGICFVWGIEDDPNRRQLSEQEKSEFAEVFKKRIADELSEVAKGLADDTSQISRKLYSLKQDNKLDVSKLLNHEINIRENSGLQ